MKQKPNQKSGQQSRPFKPKAHSPRELPICELHPISIQQIKNGHPWVTKDRYSMAFPQQADLIGGQSKNRQLVATLINDPKHPHIKARLWDTRKSFIKARQDFMSDLSTRIDWAISKRKELGLLKERENFYLVFGESDYIPGLHALKFGNIIIVQYYAYCWARYEKKITEFLTKAYKKHFPDQELLQIRFQQRNHKQELKENVFQLSTKDTPRPTLVEFGVRYQTLLNERYDIGLYTDAASIRKKIAPFIQDQSKVLNLYAYTGAFSLLALKKGATEVHSVDLSQKVMKWLEKNIQLNEFDKNQKHVSHQSTVSDALDKFIREGQTFSQIIIDPPPSFFDGKKKETALESYQKDLPKMMQILEPHGHILALLNTQKVSREKFIDKINNILDKHDEEEAFEIIDQWGLEEDCKPLNGFPEGDYLKALLIHRQW